jgi:hypothetical protein
MAKILATASKPLYKSIIFMKAFVQCGKSLLKASHLKFWYDRKCCERIDQVLSISGSLRP